MKSATLVVLLALGHLSPAICQVPQSRPELCGSTNAVVSSPPGFSAAIDRANIDVVFSFRDGATVAKVPAILSEIEQVCPLPGNRVAVFGTTSGPTAVYLIDIANSLVLDFFGGYNPIMSPDQRWIAYRKAYPSHGMTEQVSEEYLLYDLSRNATQNRAPGIPLSDNGDVGLPIFPWGQKNLPGDHIGVPSDQLHVAASQFFWSPDGKSLLFADSLQDEVSLVFIRIESSGPVPALVFPLGASPCAHGPVSHVELGPEQGTDRLLFVSLPTGCTPQRLQIRLSEFKLAKTEIHQSPTNQRKTVVVP